MVGRSLTFVDSEERSCDLSTDSVVVAALSTALASPLHVFAGDKGPSPRPIQVHIHGGLNVYSYPRGEDQGQEHQARQHPHQAAPPPPPLARTGTPVRLNPYASLATPNRHAKHTTQSRTPSTPTAIRGVVPMSPTQTPGTSAALREYRPKVWDLQDKLGLSS